MYWLDLKKWNKQWHNPKITVLLRNRIERMLGHYRSTMIINCEDCDITAEQLDAILKGYPEDRFKCEGPLSPTAFLRSAEPYRPSFQQIQAGPLEEALTLLRNFQKVDNL